MDEEEKFTVEAIRNHMEKEGKYYFLVKWLGYPESENSYEPQQNLAQLDVFAEYWAKHKPKRRDLTIVDLVRFEDKLLFLIKERDKPVYFVEKTNFEQTEPAVVLKFYRDNLTY